MFKIKINFKLIYLSLKYDFGRKFKKICIWISINLTLDIISQMSSLLIAIGLVGPIPYVVQTVLQYETI